jgi:hypothetical protein
MDLIELIFQNRAYYNDLEKIVNTHRKDLAYLEKEENKSKKEHQKKLAEYKSGKRHKVTIYTITDDISNKHGSSSEHILESYADEAENDAHGCVTREEDEEYLTDAELDDWAEFNGTKEELAEWRKQRELEQFAQNAPKFAGSPELEKYYKQSEQQAMTAPTQSALYKQQMNQIGRQMGMGIGAGGDVSKLTQIGTDAAMRAAAGAEQQKEQRFARLGNVMQQKAAEGLRKFQINQMQPYQTKYNLLAAKAAAAARQQEAGLQNIVGGASDLISGLASQKKSSSS